MYNTVQIKSVKRVKKAISIPVYDVTVSSNHNFVLSNGCVVHNSVLSARDSNFQEALALKGKILNVMREKKADRVFDNEEVMNILKSIGFVPDIPDPISKLRVGKIILCADADVDGPVVGESKVLLVDGTRPTIKELVDRWAYDQTPFDVWSVNSNGKLVVAQGIEPKLAKNVTGLATLTLQDGTTFECSLDHKWLITNCEDEDVRATWRTDQGYVCTKDLVDTDTLCFAFVKRGLLSNIHVKSVTIHSCEPTPVYCLTVPETGNFMFDDGLGNGICSSNSHINSLILGCLYRFVPGVFARNMVYVAKGAEYLAQTPTGNFYADTLDELKGKIPPKYHGYILHLKGWGEANADAFSDMAFNPRTRKLLKIKPFDKQGETRFKALMQESISYREELLGLTR